MGIWGCFYVGERFPEHTQGERHTRLCVVVVVVVIIRTGLARTRLGGESSQHLLSCTAR